MCSLPRNVFISRQKTDDEEKHLQLEKYCEFNSIY